ncbi:F0F1 ATP synthase subunit epsilon [Actinotignum sanguinis]|uniref:ATP synthase F1 complex delta/epsilon subunit N-terminal domain-containing protein n=2 Tax=Actinomycetaceae TaxID=2049 RepID=A0ABZ0RDT1_9ACTO|nr:MULTISPECIES: F0F1 ATP synthase subunit epsilon [Actinotignum]WPJ89165.1 hypothetical protein R0V15_00795 [Schaalia turicensis]MDE1553564.1 hypothetical protein [Actinotignum sanguinis]MDE1564771.1 hypothetical protein [Actinotignum sanguinis]MDE1576806.1 hypothetical protein [Actinotignum sanguinis]MDE1642374.1 hypothetical protein [Actinotignum sanguinis]
MLDVEIVSQRELAWRGNAESVTAPGTEGSVGILTDHTPLVALLTEGNVEVRGCEDGRDRSFTMSGSGFLTVTANQVIVVADSVTEQSVSGQ